MQPLHATQSHLCNSTSSVQLLHATQPPSMQPPLCNSTHSVHPPPCNLLCATQPPPYNPLYINLYDLSVSQTSIFKMSSWHKLVWTHLFTVLWFVYCTRFNCNKVSATTLSLSLHYLCHIYDTSFVHGQGMGSRRIWAFLSNTTATQFPYQLKYYTNRNSYSIVFQ